MSTIQQLPESVYARIAAGEVIVNPAAAAKELIENAMDAGATGITIEVADGGRSMIRVTDNGEGIPENELPAAVERHATSKIRTFEDLYSLQSMGFRGEALSSMAEVSRFTLSSRQHGAEMGARLTVAGGSTPQVEAVGIPEGTTVRVEDLFYNIPARRKFMKSGPREGTLVSEAVRRALLSRPDIAFKYIRNGRIAYQTSGDGDLRAALSSVYGPEILRELIDVHLDFEGGTVSGCITRPSYVVKSAQRIDFFVNGRYIQSKPLQKALIRGYGESLLHGHYPAAAIHLKLRPDMLDVNVHPAKLTALFYDEDQVVSHVLSAVQSAAGQSTGAPYVALRSSEEAAERHGRDTTDASHAGPNPDFWVTVPRRSGAEEEFRTSSERKREASSIPEVKASPAPIQGSSSTAASLPHSDEAPRSNLDAFTQLIETRTDIPPEPEEEQDVRSMHSSRVVGSVFSTYLICEAEGRLFFIDQHAARERLTYESLLEWTRTGKKYAQMLLIPVVRTFTAPEFAALMENQQLLEELGLTFEEFGELTLRFFSLPVQMGSQDVDQFLADVVDELGSHPEDPVLARERLISSACRHSVKGGTELTQAEMQTLVKEITQMESIPFCPHGRPIAVEVTREQLEKGFRRRV